MTSDERKRMNELCVEIQEEKNFHRYEKLTRELSSLVEKKERRFPERRFSLPSVAGKGWKFMPAAVTKVIPTVGGVEKVEIQIPEADDLFREIRVENSFEDWQGNALAIRAGAPLDVRLEASASSLLRKQQGKGKLIAGDPCTDSG